MLKILTIIAAISTIIAIWTDYRGPRKLFFLFKPLTTLIIIAIAVLGVFDSGALTIAPYFVIAGLAVCMVGDIFIMKGDRTFLYGLVSFALAHVLFSVALVVMTGVSFTWWLFLVFVLVGVSFALFILPHTAGIKFPVIIYITILTLMMWLSWERLNVLRDFASAYWVLGSLLFGISDTILAIDHFKKKFKLAELFILGTYFPSIWLIAFSLYLSSI